MSGQQPHRALRHRIAARRHGRGSVAVAVLRQSGRDDGYAVDRDAGGGHVHGVPRRRRDGFLSIVYAGLHPAEVAGVISFVGGWTADWCNGAFNTRRLAEAGAGAEAAQLWLHGDNDGYYRADHIRENHAAFMAAGGRAALHMLTGVPYDGHRLAAYPDRWTCFAAEYLNSLPTQP